MSYIIYIITTLFLLWMILENRRDFNKLKLKLNTIIELKEKEEIFDTFVNNEEFII